MPTANGTFLTTATAYGSNGLPVTTSPLSFGVGIRPLITSFQVSKTTLDLGMSTTFNSDVSGGTLPLSYVYSPLPMGCTTADLASFVCTPTSPGTLTTELTVTDSVGVVVTANVTVSVSPPLTSGSLTTDPAVVTVSVPFNLSAGSVGGSTPLTYAFAGLAGELLQSGPPRPRLHSRRRGDLLDLREHHRRSGGGRLG